MTKGGETVASVITAIAALMTAIAAIVATPITAYINAKASIQAKDIEIRKNALLHSIDSCADAYEKARNPAINGSDRKAAIVCFSVAARKMMAQAGIDDCWDDIDSVSDNLEYCFEADCAENQEWADEQFNELIFKASKVIASDTKTRTKAKSKSRSNTANTSR